MKKPDSAKSNRLPRQYTSANNVQVEEESDESSLDSNEEAMVTAWLASAEDDSEERQANSTRIVRHINCGTTNRTVEVGISASKRRACLNSLTLPSNYHTAIMDSGADTCIIGKGWHVVDEHPTRRVKVVGFDKELTSKNNLPIVTAMTIVEVPDQDPILLQVNEAVLNKTADHSLMSNYQIAEFGVEVDARPIKHGGTQCMKLEEGTVQFKLRHCMVHFNHRSPTLEELSSMTPVVLTQGEAHWDPQAAEHSTDEAEAFDREVAEHICQLGNTANDLSLAEWTESCVMLILLGSMLRHTHVLRTRILVKMFLRLTLPLRTSTEHYQLRLIMTSCLNTSCTALRKSSKRPWRTPLSWQRPPSIIRSSAIFAAASKC